MPRAVSALFFPDAAIGFDGIGLGGIPSTLSVTVCWNDGSAEQFHFSYHKSGCTRDVFLAVDSKMVLKVQLMRNEDDDDDKNAKEWECFLTMPALQQVLPEFYGHVTIRFQNKRLSCLLMQQLVFTLQTLIEDVCAHYACRDTLMFIIGCVVRGIHAMVTAARFGFQLHGWNIGNLAVTNSRHPKVVMLEWKKNRLAPMTLPVRLRMSRSLHDFCSCLFRSCCHPKKRHCEVDLF